MKKSDTAELCQLSDENINVRTNKNVTSIRNILFILIPPKKNTCLI
jgi:hypothetical protein